MFIVKLYSTLTARSGGGGGGEEEDDDGGYGVLDGACGASILLFCALAASVVVFKACAFVAMAGALVGVGWCLFAGGRGGARGAAAGAQAAFLVGDGGECGLDDAAIRELPAASYERPGGGEPSGGAPVCSVCLEDVQGGETVRRLPACRHLYHARCIDLWLHLHATCPLCRSDLSPRRRAPASSPVAGSTAGALLRPLPPPV